MIFDVLNRLESDPYQQDLAKGWSAELADPLWLLGRQWQLGEHQGENASSPVAVEGVVRQVLIGKVAGQPHLDPAVIPAESIIESEPFDWWTPGRRIRIGRLVATAAAQNGRTLPADGSVTLSGLPVPYQGFNGSGPDGLRLWKRRTELLLQVAWFGTTPAPPANEPVDLWNPADLSYSATLPFGDKTLTVDRHDGGDLDWFSADASGVVGAWGTPSTFRTTPGRLRYPSAPLPRWWQIEDAGVSVGGQAPDRASIATAVLIDLIVNHSDDWFTFALTTNAGTIFNFDQVRVVDSFGDSWHVSPPSDWSLFRTRGLDLGSLVVWGTARTPLVGPVLDQVAIGIDEDSNLVWAVEQVLGGRTLPTPDPPESPPQPPADSGKRWPVGYSPMTPIPRYWHPYVVEQVDGVRRFVQGRAADLTSNQPTLLPPPSSDLLRDPAGGSGKPVHQLEPGAIASEGIRIERRAMLARSTAGQPVLWTQRRRQPWADPPTFGLRFDILERSEHHMPG